MTVRELKNLLNSLPDDFRIVTASDPEGNDFSPVDNNHSFGQIEKDEIIIPDDGEELVENCLILWPMR